MSNQVINFNKRKRSYQDIMISILETLITSPGIGQTQMMYKTNMNNGQIKTYLMKMREMGLVVMADNHFRYAITKLGIDVCIQERMKNLSVTSGGYNSGRCEKCGQESKVLVHFMSWDNCCPRCLLEFEETVK